MTSSPAAAAGAVLQQLESSFSWDSSASDGFGPTVSKYWDRINRPDQLPTALLEAMRTLTSPADTGAVTISLPQDVQAEAWDFPTALSANGPGMYPAPVPTERPYAEPRR